MTLVGGFAGPRSVDPTRAPTRRRPRRIRPGDQAVHLARQRKSTT